MTETHLQNRRFGYARVSTVGQTLDSQLEQLRAAGCTTKIYREKVTGAHNDRRELLKMLKALAPGDVVTVTRIDRLARSTFDLFAIVKQIVDAKAQFRSLVEPWADTGTSTGRLMIAVLGGLADVERDLIRTRTTEGRSRATRRGQRMGRKPKLTEAQQAEARQRRAEGATLAELARTYGVRQEHDFPADSMMQDLSERTPFTDHNYRIKAPSGFLNQPASSARAADDFYGLVPSEHHRASLVARRWYTSTSAPAVGGTRSEPSDNDDDQGRATVLGGDCHGLLYHIRVMASIRGPQKHTSVGRADPCWRYPSDAPSHVSGCWRGRVQHAIANRAGRGG